MKEKEIVVSNKIGLVSRAAANFVDRCKQYRSDVYIELDSRIYNGKSIMSVLSMSCGGGTPLLIKCDGDDAEEALEGIESYLTYEIKQY